VPIRGVCRASRSSKRGIGSATQIRPSAPASLRITYDQPTIRQDLDAQRPTIGICHHTDIGAVESDAQHSTIGNASD
jgi:hypothetical protein